MSEEATEEVTEEAAPIALESEDTTGGIGGDFGDFAVALFSDEDDAPVPPDFDDDSLWDDAARTDSRDDAASLASPSSVGASGGPGPVVEGFAEGLTARIKALLGVKNAEDAAAEREEKAKKAQKARREEKKKRREKEKKKRAAAIARVVFLNRVRRVFGFPDAEVPDALDTNASRVTADRAFDSDASDSDNSESSREPRNARERRARETLAPRATRRERFRASRALFRDAFESAFDSALRLPRRAYMDFYVSVTATRVYLFDVPGGANALLLRVFLVLEFPTLMSVFFRKDAPPFARGGDAGARLVAALTPGWALGTNAHVASTYLQLCAAFVSSTVAVFGPGCGRVCAAVAARAWQHTWLAADAVEAGGVAADADAGSETGSRRAERTRRCGAAIPRELWRAAKDSKVLRALEEHLETPAASRSAELDPEEDNRMDAWCRRGLRARSRARRLETVGKQCEAAGVACRLALGTVGFFPAVHASLATLVPMASDHNRPYAYAGFDPNVFYGSVAHLVLAAAGTATCAATFACAAFGAFELSAKVPALRVQPTFEVSCFLLKTAIAAISTVWEARLGKEPVAAAARDAAVLAWVHDGAATCAFVVLAAAHVATQSLRGDARFWNDWRAASLGGSAWTGLVTLAARHFGGFGPVRAFAFLRNRDASLGDGDASASPSGADAAFWRAFLGVSLPFVMALCAYLNGAAFGHVSLPAHLVRPEYRPDASDRAREEKRSRGETSSREKEQTSNFLDVEAGEAGSFPTLADAATSSAASVGKVKTSRVRVALASVARVATATARWVDTRVLPFSESEESRRLRAARLRDPNFVADFGPRRDRVVSWMCDFRRLDKTRASRDDRVVTIAAGFAVTDERFRDKAKHADAVNAAEELITLAVVALSSPATFAARGGDALPRAALDAAARGVGAAIAGGDRYCASFAWRAVAVFEEALRSEVPSVRAAAAGALARKDPTGRNDFADVCAALLFRRHDVGVRRPAFFDLRRWWDVALAEPEYRAANAARETGLTRAKKLDAAWRGAYLTPWPETARARARALLETDVGRIETGRADGRGDERTHLFLKALDPTGASLGGTPLAEAGLERADARAESLKELRTKLRRDQARRARRARTADEVSETVTSDVISDVQSSSGSDDSDSGFDLADGSDEALAQSHYAPDVTARRRAERHERRDAKAHGVTAAASAAAALRRVAPARRSYREPPAGSWRRFFLSFGASARLREARARHDRLRVTLANRTLASLLDAALGGEGDEVRAANEDGASKTALKKKKEKEARMEPKLAELAATAAADDGRITAGHTSLTSLSATGAPVLFLPVPALTYREMALVFLGVVVETPAPPRPGAVPPAGAAAAMAATAALALRGGGVPAFLKTDYVVLRSDGSEGKRSTPPSRTYLAAALRACGGIDRPPLVASRASEFVTELAARRRMRGALLRRLAEVMADAAAAPTGVDPDASLTALDEDARVTICVRALGLARRAGELARRDRAVAAQLSILAAYANLRGDRAALDGDVFQKTETGTETKMFLKLRARAACDAARRTDRDSLVAASRNAVRLLGDASPDVRFAAAGALEALATVLVAAEASFAAAAVASRVGECHADRGDADVPAGRWTVPRDDWEQGLGEGDDDMAPEGVAVAEAAAGEEAAEEEAAEKKAAAPKRSRHADFARPVKEDGGEGGERLGSSSDGEAETRALDPETNEPRPRPRPRDVEKGKEYRTTTTTTNAKTSAATDPSEGVFVPPDVSRRFDSARLLVTLDRAAHKDTHPGARDALFAAREAVAAARARALSAARRVATGGVLGAHVAAWAALTADAPLPGVVDAAARLKFEALVHPTRRRIAEARRLSRQEADAAAAGDVDVEAARRLESEARAATEAAAAAYGLIDAPAGEDVSAAALFAAVEGEIGAFPRPSGPAANPRESSNPRNPKSPRPKNRVTSPVRVAAPVDDAHRAYLARVKAQARRGADAPDAPLTAGELVRTTGPTPQTMAAVRVMLGRSVAKQHERHEHAARARVANRWREAREKDARRAALENQPPHLLRKGTNHENVSPSSGVGSESKEGARSRAPVDLASLRAARREAPPGGDMQLSRPTGSRPVLERTRATEAFRRVPETRAPDAVAARRAKQAAEEAAKAARKAEVSRRYYGAETFKKPVVKKNLDAEGPRVVKDSSGRTWMM